MMKNYISFLSLFIFLCFQAQVIDSLDTDKDGILDKDDLCIEQFGNQEYLGCPTFEVMCKSFVERDEKKYATLFSNASEIDYFSLEKLIIENFPTDKFEEENLGIVFFFEQEICGYPKSCSNPINLKNPVFNENNFWTKENILNLQKRLKKHIIPLPLDNYYIKKETFKEIKFSIGLTDINPAYRVKNNEPANEFYYIPYSSKKLKLIRDNNSVVHSTDNVYIDFRNPNENEVILNFNFRNETQNFSQSYHYINNQWKLIETNTN